MFWRPEDDTDAVILRPAPALLEPSSRSLSPPDGSVDTTSEDGCHIQRDLTDGQRLHLVLPEDGKADRHLAAVIPLGVEGFDRTEAVLRLLASLHGRTIPHDTRMTRQQLLRGKRMLRAIDGRRAGASQRQIARILFPLVSLTRDEWQSAPERHATRQLIKDGLALIAGGYRRLLRHRHRRLS